MPTMPSSVLESWLNRTGQEAITNGMYLCDWPYGATYRKRNWIYVSNEARIMLGLQEPPLAQPAVMEFRVLPNLCIFAGSDLSPEKLVPLFRCCKIKRIDRVLEFQLDPRQLAEAPSHGKAPRKLLADVLKELEPLPSSVANVLGAKSTTGEVRIRGCSAIVKSESPEVVEAIMPFMQHPPANPSSLHSYGRMARSAVETARGQVARLLQCPVGRNRERVQPKK